MLHYKQVDCVPLQGKDEKSVSHPPKYESEMLTEQSEPISVPHQDSRSISLIFSLHTCLEKAICDFRKTDHTICCILKHGEKAGGLVQ